MSAVSESFFGSRFLSWSSLLGSSLLGRWSSLGDSLLNTCSLSWAWFSSYNGLLHGYILESKLCKNSSNLIIFINKRFEVKLTLSSLLSWSKSNKFIQFEGTLHLFVDFNLSENILFNNLWFSDSLSWGWFSCLLLGSTCEVTQRTSSTDNALGSRSTSGSLLLSSSLTNKYKIFKLCLPLEW